MQGGAPHLFSLLLKHPFCRRSSTQVHSHLLTSGLHRHRHRHQSGDCGTLLCNTLLRHYALGRYPEEALLLYIQVSGALTDDTYTLSFLLKACANASRAAEGAQVHGVSVKKGLTSHVYVQTAAVNMYAECGSLAEASRAFDEMTQRNMVTWNVMITGLTKWGEVERARGLFDRMPRRNVVSWTGMVDGYTRAQRPAEALGLFRRMMGEGVSPTEVTVLAVAPAISNLRALDVAESVHGYVKKNGFDEADVRVCNTLIDVYAKCGILRNSLGMFEEMSERRNLVSWTSIISAFAMHGMAEEALRMFRRMDEASIRPNKVTFLCILNACSHGGLVEEGVGYFSQMMDKHGIVPDIKHFGCVVDMLGRAGKLDEAERMILEMPLEANVVLWRTLLGCCSMHGDVEMGERVMRRIMELERGYGGDYVLLSNVLVGAGRFGEAEGVRRVMDDRRVSKLVGHSLF